MRIPAIAMAFAFLFAGGRVVSEAQNDPRQLEQSCDAGDLYGCMELARRYVTGTEGFQRDAARAVSLCERACDFGYQIGCEYAVRLHQPIKGVLKDATRWAVLIEKYCDNSDGTPCLQLGLVYDLGMWVSKDPNHANELFKKGCLYGNKEACALIRR